MTLRSLSLEYSVSFTLRRFTVRRLTLRRRFALRSVHVRSESEILSENEMPAGPATSTHLGTQRGHRASCRSHPGVPIPWRRWGQAVLILISAPRSEIGL